MDEDKKNLIKVAIPTNDGINIFQKMLGRATQIFIYETDGKQFKLIEKRNNPFEKTMQHLKTLDVYDLLHDCAVIISANIGKKGIQRLKKRGMKLLFKKGSIQEAIDDVIEKEELKNIL